MIFIISEKFTVKGSGKMEHPNILKCYDSQSLFLQVNTIVICTTGDYKHQIGSQAPSMEIPIYTNNLSQETAWNASMEDLEGGSTPNSVRQRRCTLFTYLVLLNYRPYFAFCSGVTILLTAVLSGDKSV
jgi:hypothetical protein